MIGQDPDVYPHSGANPMAFPSPYSVRIQQRSFIDTIDDDAPLHVSKDGLNERAKQVITRKVVEILSCGINGR